MYVHLITDYLGCCLHCVSWPQSYQYEYQAGVCMCMYTSPRCVCTPSQLCLHLADHLFYSLAGSSHVLAAMPSVCTKLLTWSCWTSAPSSWKVFRTLSGHPRTTSCVPTSQNRQEATCPLASVSLSFLSALSFGRRTFLVSAVSFLCLCWALSGHISFPERGL